MAFYLTTPIYYVNAAPHLGHAYTTIGADILARHMRQRGEEVFFLTGTDEHGEPVAQAAEREGVTPKELADRNAARFQDLMPRINVSIDYFIRTSDPRHGKRVQEVMQRIYDNGHVYKGMYEGWYCPRCADFKTEQEIGPDNTCKIHLIPLTREQEENYFFRLSSFQEQLEQLYTDQPDFAGTYAMMRRLLPVFPALGRVGALHLIPASMATALSPEAAAEVQAFATSPRGANNMRDEQAQLRDVFTQAQALTTFDPKPLAVVTASDSSGSRKRCWGTNESRPTCTRNAGFARRLRIQSVSGPHAEQITTSPVSRSSASTIACSGDSS